MSIQWIKYGSFTDFPGEEVFRKRTVSTDFQAMGKLGEISVFYAVIATSVALYFCGIVHLTEPYNKMYSTQDSNGWNFEFLSSYSLLRSISDTLTKRGTGEVGGEGSHSQYFAKTSLLNVFLNLLYSSVVQQYESSSRYIFFPTE